MPKINISQIPNMLPVSPNFIERRIYLIRSRQVMLDSDLAELYQVETRTLIQAIKRNTERFPEDFIFQLTKEELQNLRFQSGISNLRSQIVISSYGGRRYLPYAFTEYGVVMLSSVLNSTRAIQMNIAIVRAFIQLRIMLEEYKSLSKEVAKIKGTQDLHTKVLVKVVKNLKIISTPSKINAIGFQWKPKSI
jgi:ORF6N domain